MYSQLAELAYERQREQREDAANHRLCNELASANLWHRLADYAAQRSVRSQRRLDEHSAAEFQLVG